MTIQLKIARTSAEMAQVYQMRHAIFVEEEQRFDMQGSHLFDRFDGFSETTNIVAYCEGEPVAGIRVVLDGPAGLPAQEAFDFSPLRRTLTGGFATVGWFCIRKRFRRHPGLTVSLIQMCFRQMRKHNARHVLAVMHPPAVPLFSRLVGARALAEEFEDHVLGVGIIPTHVDIDNLPPGSRERFAEPNGGLFEDADERRLYRKNETIYARNESGREVFQVMRGVVQVKRETAGTMPTTLEKFDSLASDIALLGPGQTFGELSALDGMGRTTTVTANASDVDVMVWDRATFMQQLTASPDRAVQLCRLMAQRIRRGTEAKRINPSVSLAARLLVGAAGRENQPVDARWLAGQCGVDRSTLSRLVSPWAQEQMVSADSEQKKIWVIDRCRLTQEAHL